MRSDKNKTHSRAAKGLCSPKGRSWRKGHRGLKEALGAALTSQLELIELNKIKEFHAEMKMSATKRDSLQCRGSPSPTASRYLWAKDLRAKTRRHLYTN